MHQLCRYILFVLQNDAWHRISWAFLKAGGDRGGRREEGEEGRGEGDDGEGSEGGGEGLRREEERWTHVGKRCRLQLYQYPKRHKYTPGTVEVSLALINGIMQ